MLALGLMTGTALDGYIDAALIETDGESVHSFGPQHLHAYDDSLRALMARAVKEARIWAFNGPEPKIFAEAERAFTHAHAEAVGVLAAKSGLTVADLDVVGFHGLTVLHRPSPGDAKSQTRQLGNGELLARLLGVDVVFDYRSADMAAGGQGAPLTPIYHVTLLERAGMGSDHAILNLGGVANLTWNSESGQLIAFDTGPANGPINEWMESLGLGKMDRDGALASRGQANEARLAQWLKHPFFDAPYPKALDRYDFSAELAEGLFPADGAASLTAFAAAAVGCGLDLLPSRPDRLIVCGGGRKNPALTRAIRERAGVETLNADTIGWRGDAIEAEAFAFLAARAVKGLPITFPLTTGVPAPMTGGRIAYGS